MSIHYFINNGTVSNSINLYAGNTDREWLLSPSFDVTGAASEIVVEVAVTDYASSTNPATMGSDDEVQLLSSVDSGVTWTVMTTWNVGNQPDVAGTTFTAALPSSSNIQFAIWASDGTVDNSEDYDFHIGAFQVRDIPACPDITGLTLDYVTATVAQISWTAGGSESDWEIVVQSQGTGAPSGSGIATSDNPIIYPGLTELTAYEAYVRSDCGGGQLGAWVGPLNFTTTALCPEVSGITIDSFTSDSVTVSWTNGGTEDDWEVLVQADGTGSPSSGTATTTNPHTESGLTGNTAYEVYVRADCNDASNGYSEWVGPVDFTTDCSIYTPDYSEDFTTFLDDCWDEATDGDLTAGPASFGSGAFLAEEFAHVGTGNGAVNINMYLGGPDIDWLLSPSFDLSADGYELVVDVALTNYNATSQGNFNTGDEVRIVYSNDGTNWTDLIVYNDTNQPAAAGQTETIDLTGITGSNVQFAFYVSEGTTGRDIDFHIDNFIVRTPPTCSAISAIAVTNITTTSADVDWTAGGSETNWEIAVQAAGTGEPAAADGSGTDTATNSYSATGLTASSNYEVWVRAECTAGTDFGAWVGPVNFATACDVISTFPFTEDFEGNGDVIPTCWTQEIETGTTNWTFDSDGDAGGVGTSNNAHSGSRNARFSDSDTADDITKLIMPAMDISGLTNPELVFWHTQELWSPDQDELSVYYKTSAGGAWTLLASYTADLPDWTKEALALPSPSADYYIAFEGNAVYGRGVALDDVLIWDNVPTTFTYTSGTWTPLNPMGLSSSDDDIVIASGDFVLDADMSCDRFDVLPGASLTIDSSVTLTLSDILQLQSSSTSYSSLILDGSVAGSIFYDRHVNINGSGTTGSNDLISAPLTGQAFSAVAAGNPNILNNGTLYLFGPFEKITGQYVNWAGTETATLDAGVGYRAATSDNSVVTFSGTAENGTVTNDIINGGTNNEEWNLVGNPYPSYLNVQDFLSHDVGGVTNLQLFDTPTAGIYGYDGSALNGWTIYNLANTTASTVMAPGQGFFISANAANTGAYDLEFSPDMRRTGNSDDFIVGRNAALTYLILNVSANSKSYNTDFYFNANATQGLDLGYDANIWGNTAPDFAIYSHLVQDNAGDPVALQALSQTDLNDVTIALGVNANQGEQITFSIADMTIPASVNIYLEDVVANTVTLLNNSDYVFTPTTDLSGTGRFFLRTSEDALSTIDNSLDKLDIFTLKASDELVVSGQIGNNTMLNLYDTQGRVVLSTKLDHTLLQNRINVSSINSGVYIVTVLNNSQEKTKKVIIN